MSRLCTNTVFLPVSRLKAKTRTGLEARLHAGRTRTTKAMNHQAAPSKSEASFAGHFAPGAMSLEGEIDRLLSALGLANVRLSLIAVSVPDIATDVLVTIARAALSSFHLVGVLANGSVGILYMGPRPAATEGDRALESDIVERLEGALKNAMDAHVRHGAKASLKVRSAHRWTDEIGDAGDLVRALTRIPTRRSHAVGSPNEARLPSPAVASGTSSPAAPVARHPWRALLLAFVLAAAWVVAMSAAARASEQGAPTLVCVYTGDAKARTLPATPQRRANAWNAADIVDGMDAGDKACVAEALARAADGTDVEWVNPHTGMRYAVYLIKTDALADGAACRALTLTTVDGERVYQAYRIVCRRSNATRAAQSASQTGDLFIPSTVERGN